MKPGADLPLGVVREIYSQLSSVKVKITNKPLYEEKEIIEIETDKDIHMMSEAIFDSFIHVLYGFTIKKGVQDTIGIPKNYIGYY